MSEEKKNIREKFVEIQRELMPLDYKPDARGYGYEYVSFGKICKAVLPVVNRNDCGIIFDVHDISFEAATELQNKNGKFSVQNVALRVRVELIDKDESITKEYCVSARVGDKVIQEIGGAYTYAKRYALAMFFALPIGEYDPGAFSDEPKNTAQTPKNEKNSQKPAQQSTPPGVGKAELELEKSRAKIYASIDKHGLFRETEDWCRERGVQAWTDEGDELNHELTQQNLAELYVYLKKIVEERK